MLNRIGIVVAVLFIAWFLGVFRETPVATESSAHSKAQVEQVTPSSESTSVPATRAPKPLITGETKPPAIDKSPSKQKGREALIKKLIAEKVFLKTATPGTMPRVYVGPKFYALNFDTKQGFISVVYAYHFDGSRYDDMVKVMDGFTNKEIGVYWLPPLGNGLQLN